MKKAKVRRRPRSWRRLDQLDPGLQLAVKAAGSISALARLIHISPQSISGWGPIPINRVLDVEEATGVNRAKLRPDFYKRMRKAAAE